MSLIDRTIDISLRRVRDTIPSVGFGIPLFIGESLTTFPEVVKSYSSLEEVLVDFTELTPEYLAAKAVFSQSNRVASMLIGQKLDETTILAAYNVIKAINPDFYMVGIGSNVQADILSIAGQIETEERMFAVSTDQAAILIGTTGNIAESLFNLGYQRTWGMWNAEPIDQAPNMALASYGMSRVPGSITYSYQQLSGVVADDFTNAEQLQLEAYNMNYYTRLAGLSCTIGGKTFSGEWIDVIHSIDWLIASLRVSLASLLINVETKIPYTERGDTLIRNAINSVLTLAADNEVINDDYTITFSPLNTVSLANKTARVRDGIEIFVTLTGAIHSMKLRLTVSD